MPTRPDPEPLETNDVALVAAGTALWTIALVVLAVIITALLITIAVVGTTVIFRHGGPAAPGAGRPCRS